MKKEGVNVNQAERRIYLLNELLKENIQFEGMHIPKEESEQRRLLRSLMNVRLPLEISCDFIKVQDEYIREENEKRGIVNISDLTPIRDGVYVWRGDITTLECGAIVNAANSGMTGCYQPCHNCIDNCIHTYAGVQLRYHCSQIMKKQGYEEPTGGAKITPAYNLPCEYVIHTVGPIVQGRITEKHCKLLQSCYRSCLELADEYKISSIVFCCISTGVFSFPNKKAAEIAVKTVLDYKDKTDSRIEVVYNVFKEEDEQIYRKLLG